MWKTALYVTLTNCSSDFLWFSALSRISAAPASAMYNTIPFFVYILSMCFLHERISLIKITGMLVSFSGVTLILMYQGDPNASSDDVEASKLHSAPFIGGIFTILSAILAAAFQVEYKLMLGQETNHVPTFLISTGMIGLMTIPFWIVGTIAVAHSPFEPFYEPYGWPPTSSALLVLHVVGLLGVVISTTASLVMGWASPLEASVANLLTIPLCGVLDKLLHNTTFSGLCILGALLVMGGFLGFEVVSASVASPVEIEDEKEVQTRCVGHHR